MIFEIKLYLIIDLDWVKDFCLEIDLVMVLLCFFVVLSMFVLKLFCFVVFCLGILFLM